MISHDIVIVGSGLAGLRGAIEAYDGSVDVAVVTNLFPIRSHSTQAQVGINASLANYLKERMTIGRNMFLIRSKAATSWRIKMR